MRIKYATTDQFPLSPLTDATVIARLESAASSSTRAGRLATETPTLIGIGAAGREEWDAYWDRNPDYYRQIKRQRYASESLRVRLGAVDRFDHTAGDWDLL